MARPVCKSSSTLPLGFRTAGAPAARRSALAHHFARDRTPKLHSKDCYQHDDRVDRDSRKGNLFGDIAPYACSGLQAVSLLPRLHAPGMMVGTAWASFRGGEVT